MKSFFQRWDKYIIIFLLLFFSVKKTYAADALMDVCMASEQKESHVALLSFNNKAKPPPNTPLYITVCIASRNCKGESIHIVQLVNQILTINFLVR
jgi:hypothetical protein